MSTETVVVFYRKRHKCLSSEHIYPIKFLLMKSSQLRCLHPRAKARGFDTEDMLIILNWIFPCNVGHFTSIPVLQLDKKSSKGYLPKRIRKPYTRLFPFFSGIRCVFMCFEVTPPRDKTTASVPISYQCLAFALLHAKKFHPPQ